MNDSFVDKLIQATKPMRFAATGALMVLALFLAVKAIDAFGEIGRPDTPAMNTITVSGEGKSTATPDIAKFTFTVFETAPVISDAQSKATEKTDGALSALTELGVKEEDVKTTSSSISPQYDYGQPCYPGMACPNQTPKISGYQVSHTVEVTVRDITKAGEVLSKLGALGVQNVYGPEFTLDDPEKVKAEARAEAIEKAQAQAKTLAKDLGVRLGKVVSYYDNSAYGPYYGMGGMEYDSVKASAPQLPPGVSEYSANISITYEIR